MCRKRKKNKIKSGYSPKNKNKNMAYYSTGSLTTTELNTPANENNLIKLDMDLLMDLCDIQSVSRSEINMSTYIVDYLFQKHVEEIVSGNITVTLDTKGNLYIVKGTIAEGEYYPCVVAHMDTVHSHINNRKIYLENNTLFAMDLETFTRNGIGGDDRCGIYAALDLLKYVDTLKIFFSVEEEIGLCGSKVSISKYFDNVGYFLQADRKGSTDFITKTNGKCVWPAENLAEIEDILIQYNYTEATGTSTDIGHLATVANVIAANISSGYFSAHSSNEVIQCNCLENCVNLMYKIINRFGLVRKDHIPSPTYSSYTTDYTHYGAYGRNYSDVSAKTSKKTNEVVSQINQKATSTIVKQKVQVEDGVICDYCENGNCNSCPYYSYVK